MDENKKDAPDVKEEDVKVAAPKTDEPKSESAKGPKTSKAEQGGFQESVKSTYRAYKAEFKKIVWPSRELLMKHTVTVVTVSLLFGAYIALTDGILSALFTRFVQFLN